MKIVHQYWTMTILGKEIFELRSDDMILYPPWWRRLAAYILSAGIIRISKVSLAIDETIHTSVKVKE